METGSATANHSSHEGGLPSMDMRSMAKMFWGEEMGEVMPPTLEARAMPMTRALPKGWPGSSVLRGGATKGGWEGGEAGGKPSEGRPAEACGHARSLAVGRWCINATSLVLQRHGRVTHGTTPRTSSPVHKTCLTAQHTPG